MMLRDAAAVYVYCRVQKWPGRDNGFVSLKHGDAGVTFNDDAYVDCIFASKLAGAAEAAKAPAASMRWTMALMRSRCRWHFTGAFALGSSFDSGLLLDVVAGLLPLNSPN